MSGVSVVLWGSKGSMSRPIDGRRAIGVSALLPAVFAALVCHGIVFSGVKIVFSGTPHDYASEFFFWGSIVRKDELSPGLRTSSVVPAGEATFVFQTGPGRFLLWDRGLALDKPEMLGEKKASVLPEPFKFSGPRVVIDGDQDSAASIEFPAPPRIRLRDQKP